MPVGERIWVIDEVQPVAVVLDAGTGALQTVVAWPQVPPPVAENWRGSWQVRPAADGLWVQQPGGPLALVTEDGFRSGHLTTGLTLGGVSAHGAWCLPDPPVQDIAAREDTPPPGGGGVHQLLVAHPERTTRSVYVDSPVHGARSIDGDLYLQVESGRWSRRNLGTEDSWVLEPETTWLHLPAQDPIPPRLSLTTHTSAAPRGEQVLDLEGGRQHTSGWLRLPGSSERRQTPSWSTATPRGITWYAGRDREHPGRDVAAVAWDPASGTELSRTRLGPGMVRAMTATQDWLWIAIEGPRNFATYSDPSPTRLVRLRADGGRFETVLPPDTVNITDNCWPLPPEPIDAADYTAHWRERLTDLEHYWTHSDGRRGPLTGGISNSSVAVVGSWPNTELHVTFAHALRPGHRIRRIVPLFDELGRHAAPEYAAIHLMETLDTEDLPNTAPMDADYLDV
ncbi:hypothetical protein O2V63_13345 [Modestobacter sp. VKM Ac-2977]|uniref:hypothetical protein n=1 Tax=Modestobacter sp. VKM Ac-2977 TaxID=3004131 RepID=UPI0022AA4FC7|nr:hypothetical protein [Modestobacter sp. VKM Ac-2977]MCZ2821324.1 hypothetical protein [Modestobacter sp. VKM Ac-2977]